MIINISNPYNDANWIHFRDLNQNTPEPPNQNVKELSLEAFSVLKFPARIADVVECKSRRLSGLENVERLTLRIRRFQEISKASSAGLLRNKILFTRSVPSFGPCSRLNDAPLFPCDRGAYFLHFMWNNFILSMVILVQSSKTGLYLVCF